MSHSYVSCHIHYIFSTKDRTNFLYQDMQTRLWQYLGGIVRENNMKAITVGGTDNHIHMLVSVPSTITIAKAIQLIKGGSSKWINERYTPQGPFAWQEGYGAFAVSPSLLTATIKYINTQKQHHRNQTFEEEFIAFLEKYGIEYNRKYVFG